MSDRILSHLNDDASPVSDADLLVHNWYQQGVNTFENASDLFWLHRKLG
jgi:hypothetical protein